MIWDIKPGQGGLCELFLNCIQELPGFTWTGHYQPCWHCEKPCIWVDCAFEAPLHPGRCSEAKQDEYQWAEVFRILRERGMWG